MRSTKLWDLNRVTARSHCPVYSVQKIHRTAKDSDTMRVEEELTLPAASLFDKETDLKLIRHEQ